MPLRRESTVPVAVLAALFVALVGALLLVLVAPLGARFTVWDDAFMFARYADNLRVEGRVAWNPGGPATYGLTSVLYLLVVYPLRLLFSHDPLPALVAASSLCALVFVALAIGLAWSASGGLPRTARGSVVVIVAASLLLGGRLLATHPTSGMDTAFALAFLAGYLLVGTRFERHERQGSGAKASVAALGVLGGAGGVAIGVRPDLLLFTFAVPLAVALGAAGRREAKRALFALGVTAGTALAWLVAARIYFGTALPLPFYAKSTALYRDLDFARYGAKVPLAELARFCRANGALLALVVLPIAIAPARWWRETPAVVKGALAASAVYVTYYLLFVFQLMYFDARFYYPVLPALVLAAAHGATLLLRRWPRGALAGGCLAALALVVAPLPAGRADSLLHFAFARGRVVDSYRALLGQKLFALDRFSLLPDDLVIAATEVGHLGAMNPRKTVIDVAGLNDPAFALAPFSAARLFSPAPDSRRPPDLLYLPHPVYRGMLEDVLADPTFRADYEFYPPAELGTQMGIALRRESPHHEAMAAIVASARPRPALPARVTPARSE